QNHWGLGFGSSGYAHLSWAVVQQDVNEANVLGSVNELFDPPVSFQASIPPVTETIGNNLFYVVAGNFIKDSAGKPDLIVTDYGKGVVHVLANSAVFGPNGLIPEPDIPVGSQPLGISKGDFDNDNNLDIAVANYGSGTVSVLLGDGQGHFGLKSTI